MSELTVTIEMTVDEAKGLWKAAGNVLDHEDAAEAAFPDAGNRDAAGRGLDKLARAWVEAIAEEPGSPR